MRLCACVVAWVSEGYCQSALPGPGLFLVPAQPCVRPGLNIKAALSIDLYASIQAMRFCPTISSEPSWGR